MVLADTVAMLLIVVASRSDARPLNALSWFVGIGLCSTAWMVCCGRESVRLVVGGAAWRRGVVGSALGTLAVLAYARLVQQESVEVSVVSSILQFSILIPIVTGIVIYGTPLTRGVLMGMVLCLLSCVCLLVDDEMVAPWSTNSLLSTELRDGSMVPSLDSVENTLELVRCGILLMEIVLSSRVEGFKGMVGRLKQGML